MKKISLFALFVLCCIFSNAQDSINCYRIYLHDKANTPYSVQQPQQFLSERAIAKRARFNIAITEQDFPVNPAYLQAIRQADDSVLIMATSRWFNTVSIRCPETSALSTISGLAFVDSIVPIGYLSDISEQSEEPIINYLGTIHEPITDSLAYGKGFPQIAIHNGHLLHNEGYKGEGMLIAMLDGGWLGFNRNEFFTNLYENGQIVGTYNFVPGQSDVYWKDSHGTSCASIILSNINDEIPSGPYTFVGTAPNANMIFIRTENVDSEQLMEEDFWVAGAEIADSVGTDVITSSLGYTVFESPDLNIGHSSLDGHTSLASRAATLAAHKGIVVCVSAGNDGDKEWHRISRPADAEDILTVGAVGIDSIPADFTSIGPSFDGRVKPDVASVGFQTHKVNSWILSMPDSTSTNEHPIVLSFVVPGNGTSFATPCLAGLATCLWQALPEYSALEIMQMIREAGHQYNTPDTLWGYGIPDFYRAYLEHRDTTGIHDNQLLCDLSVFPTPCHNQCSVQNTSADTKEIAIFDMNGRMIHTQRLSPESVEVISTEKWTNGLYLLLAKSDKGWSEAIKIIKQ